MCTVSNIMDGWRDGFPHRFPWVPSEPGTHWLPIGGITREEFEALKTEVQELKELLRSAKHFDEATGQPECESAEKIEMLRKIAQVVGVNMDDVFPEQT